MNSMASIGKLLKKDLALEWRQKSTFAAMLIYVISTVFVIYFSFAGSLDTRIWIAMYWIVLLFVCVNLTMRSFSEEAGPQFYYVRTVARAFDLMVAKILFNGLYFLILSGLTCLFMALFLGFEMDAPIRFVAVSCVGAIGLSSMFTLLSAITARIDNVALMAILGFPIILPLLLLSIKLSLISMDPLRDATFARELLILGGLDVLVLVLSIILFTYLWRD